MRSSAALVLFIPPRGRKVRYAPGFPNPKPYKPLWTPVVLPGGIPGGRERRRTRNAIALVGTAPAVQTGTAGNAVAGVWGTGQNRTAGNLLTCSVSGNGVGTAPSTPSGWSFANTFTGTSCSSGVFYKVAAGGDAAPTISAVASQIWNVQLNEYSGCDPTTPFDQGGSVAGTTSPQVCKPTNPDYLAAQALCVYAYAVQYSTAATKTFTPTFNNGQSNNVTSNAGTSTVSHYWMDWGLTANWNGGVGAADQVSLAVTTTKLVGVCASMGTFRQADIVSGHVNSFSLNNSSTGATTYQILTPHVTKNDIIVVSGASNGTHATNGMVCNDDVYNTNYTVVAEVQNTNASSRWGQAFVRQTDIIGPGQHFSFTPYAAATTSSFSIDIFRGYTATVDQAATTNNTPLGTTANGTAFAAAPAAGTIVVAYASAASTSLTLGTGTGTFTAGSQTTTTADTGIAYVLVADGTTNYVASWTLGASNSWGVIQISLQPLTAQVYPPVLQTMQAVTRASVW